MDLLTIQERIKMNIGLRESQFREFKSAWEGKPEKKVPREPREIAQDIGKTLVGFANADGGELLVGVEDGGEVTGIPHPEKAIQQLLQAPKEYVHKDTPLPSYVSQSVTLEGSVVLYFYVDKSTSYFHLTSDGKCLQRKDKETVPVSVEKMKFERQEKISREFDRKFVDGAYVHSLDLELLVQSSTKELRGFSPEKILQYFDLAEPDMGGLRVRQAALLLFSKDIKQWHPRCSVRVVRVRGNELLSGRDYNAISDEIVTDNILNLLKTAWIKIRPHLTETRFFEGGLFKEDTMYPEDAVSEALLNALAHRDYSIEGRGIEIFIYDNRMEVHSPGGLLSSLTIDDIKKLKGAHETRNAKVAKVLVELGYMREMGEGMRRIFHLMKAKDLVSPELISDQNQFSVVLRHDSVFSNADQRWLSGYKALKLTREEMLVALLGKEGQLISYQKIWDTLDLVDTAEYTNITYTLQVKGILFRAIPRSLLANKKKSKRLIPQYGIRDSQECEKSLADLYSLIARIGAMKYGYSNYTKELLRNLNDGNVYKAETPMFHKLLNLIGLFDENKEPTQLLQGMWTSYITSQNNQNIFEDSKVNYSQKGTVNWFSSGKGYGFIKMENGSEIFVHYSDIICSGFKTLAEGQRVGFNIVQKDRGPQASEVIII